MGTIVGMHNPQTNPDANPSAYTRFRFRLMESRGGGRAARIADLVLWSEGKRADLSEAAVNVTDTIGVEVTLEENGTRLSDLDVFTVVVEMPQPFRIDGLSFVTGPNEDDDPMAFALEGASETEPWSLLVQLNGYHTPRARMAYSDVVLIHGGTTVYDIGIPSGPAV